MLDRVTLQAQAKLNLTLEITGRRADGYHLLRSVMQSVSICDLLEIERSPEGWELRCDDPALSCGEDNTVTRSMRAFVETARPKGGVRIVLRKRLPYQAGLGSASADAAATLLGLNLLFGEPLAADALAALGLRIGADVPFGLQGGTMLAQGIGEQLTPLPPLTGGVFVIAKPAEGM
ncbi:MAG: 4-(cytidine 5'-diphospho)-2-C-methyl-D-erythritol kinase, partial [Oscillospiraceae bacterium]